MRSAQAKRGATRIRPKPAIPVVPITVAGIALLSLIFFLTSGSDTDETTPESAVLAADQSQDVMAHVLAESPEPELTVIEEVVEEVPWKDTKVRNGDNLSLIFQRMGLNDGDVHAVVSSSKEAKKLAQIFPGQTLSFQIDDGELLALKHEQSPLESTLYSLDDDGYRVERQEREPDIKRSFAGAEISSSLFLAGTDAGLSHNTIMELANIFGGVIDFVLDPRKGDTFNVLYEDLYLDGEKFDDGNILAVEFVNRGTSHIAYRYTDANGKTGYFNPEGVSMRKAFLRAPLDFTRVSSNFNPNRLHPVLKYKRPHRGTDYAAPTGTPVFAAGDGRIIEAGYTRANGNYVVIQHGQQYTTKYLHLHKRAVKRNERVKQQQIIGWVGSTGLASGPHLHYEFLVNGVHRNPRTILQKLPKAESLHEAEMPRFREQTATLGHQLASFSQQRLASTASPLNDATL